MKENERMTKILLESMKDVVEVLITLITYDLIFRIN